MPIQTAEAEWTGDLKNGQGALRSPSGTLNGRFNYGTRFEAENGSNPEELIGAALAGCFSMALSHKLAQAGFPPALVHTKADVHLDQTAEGFAITRIDLNAEGQVPGIAEDLFQRHAEDAKATCPVSKALAGTSISLKSRLLQPAQPA